MAIAVAWGEADINACLCQLPVPRCSCCIALARTCHCDRSVFRSSLAITGGEPSQTDDRKP
jgi:hypothetical protein